MFDEQDEENLIADLQTVSIALLVLLGLRRTGQNVSFDRQSGQFIIDGRRVNQQTIRNLIDRIGDRMRRDMRQATEDLFANRIDLDEWQRTMDRKITSGHWASAALILGGLSVARRAGWLFDRIRQEKRYAQGFKNDIRTERTSGARATYRASSYADAIKVTAAEGERRKAESDGLRFAYRVITAQESCAGCLTWAGRWIRIEDMPPIGSLDCVSHCKCVMYYR